MSQAAAAAAAAASASSAASRRRSSRHSPPSDDRHSFSGQGSLWGSSHPRRNNFRESLFDIVMSDATTSGVHKRVYPDRVTVSCPEKGDVNGKVVRLPNSFDELLKLCKETYGFLPYKITDRHANDIEEIDVIRDGDSLVFHQYNYIDET